MKKILYYLPLGILISLLYGADVFAANPGLVASIRGNDVLTLVDVEQEVVIPNNVIVSTGSKESSEALEVLGVLERLQNNNNLETLASTSDEVSSKEDLEKFTRAIVRRNPDVVSIIITDTSVTVTRTVPAKLLWTIAVDGKETTEVTSWGDGSPAVRVTRPWWGTLSDYSTNEISISSDIFRRMKAMSPNVFTTNFIPHVQAHIISEIISSLGKSDEK